MKSFKLILGALGISITIVGVALALPAETRTQPADAAQAFDHSQCQYPDRWTNPADGCDNSDPAVPECIKAMYSKAAEDACIASFVDANKQPQPVKPVAPEPSKPVNQCGGK